MSHYICVVVCSYHSLFLSISVSGIYSIYFSCFLSLQLNHPRIVGRYFFDNPKVTGANYLEMLENYAYPSNHKKLPRSYLSTGWSPFFLRAYVYKTPANDMDHLKEKIHEAVISVSRILFNATWKELYSRLVFLTENNGDHIKVFR